MGLLEGVWEYTEAETAAPASTLLNRLGGSLRAGWTAYTPTVTGITLGNGTVTGRYKRIGPTVHIKVMIVVGSTTIITGLGSISLPVANAYLGAVQVIFLDALNTYFTGVGVLASSGMLIGWHGASGAIAAFTATTPLTWTPGDEIHISATYETWA